MATKWKSRILICVWAFLFMVGLSGLLTLFTHGSDYVYRDYFKTTGFLSKLDEFTGYVSTFELNQITLEEAKKTIKVTDDEIDDYRNQYGNYPEETQNTKVQYEEKIQKAMDEDNTVVANALSTELNLKIEEIEKNYQDDEYVRAKVIKEKEKKLEEYYNRRDMYNSTYKESFLYYFKSNETGKVYTNMKDSEEVTINSKDMLYVQNMTISRDDAIHYSFQGYEELADSLLPTTTGRLEGKIAVPKHLSTSSPIIEDYNFYQNAQMILWVYSAAGILALILCFFISKKMEIPADVEKWRPYYKKVPIDVRTILFIISGIGLLLALMIVNNEFLNIIDNPITFGLDIGISLIVGTFFLTLTFVQYKLLAGEKKDWANFKKQWEKAFLNIAGKKIRALFHKTKESLTVAFLHQSTGTQLFILLAIVFGLGLGAMSVIIHPILIFFYLLLLAVIGIPMVMILINKIGYFNRIVEKTNELAAGKLGENLQVAGNSVLTVLADNINVLKQGVKTSQNEQAKSERLKTELITNVSHDLRTPLTSIITYTELLKTEDVSSEDRAAYLEIIDRKSKRLKVLIEDLFEVSKMASGNMELTKDRVDLVQLLQQALAEYDETITESSLQFRVSNTEKPVYAFVDGQKLWRVFDNLIGNILKYSLEHSRVYITISTLNDQAVITFKNVSKYELNDNNDELFERFKRGDTSRHTEGSGLGLAIAQSIIDLHEGSLEIETDGDLFKVNISLRLVE
ncbi:sensor histidine kinase [Neobacillus soli]|uniref:sensor histidine kinase n=1 Tax=Neobacillus soli TaxID=220688 RepID=UPI000824493F|nr:HAMP domain-containing sensor histidine kinase [Neobacillus soli]